MKNSSFRLKYIIKKASTILFLILISLCGCNGFTWNGTIQPKLIKAEPSLIPSFQFGCLNYQADFSNLIQDILQKPQLYAGKRVTLTGFYRGWDLLDETKAFSPVTRSDWVIRDQCGAIYVLARNGLSLELNAGEKSNTDKIVRVVGIVRVTDSGQAYIEPVKVELVK